MMTDWTRHINITAAPTLNADCTASNTYYINDYASVKKECEEAYSKIKRLEADLRSERLLNELTTTTPKIKQIYYNKKKNATTVLWEDGTHTTVRKSKGTKHDLYSAVAAATAIKVFKSNTRFKRTIEEKTIEQK